MSDRDQFNPGDVVRLRPEYGPPEVGVIVADEAMAGKTKQDGYVWVNVHPGFGRSVTVSVFEELLEKVSDDA